MKKCLTSLLLLLALNPARAQTHTFPGLVAHYLFSGNAADSSGHRLHGDSHNTQSATGISGQPNTALQFYGGSFVAVPTSPLLNLDRYTIVATFRVNDFYPGLCQANILLKKGGAARGYWGMGLSYNDNVCDQDCYGFDSTREVAQMMDIYPASNYGAYVWCDSAPSIRKNNWYRLTGSFDGQRGRLYLNGVKIKDLRMDQANNNYSTDSMLIGRTSMDYDRYPWWFIGLMDDMQLYDRALSDSEVADAGCGHFVSVQPHDDSVVQSRSVSFTAGTAAGTRYRWQVSVNAGAFSDIANGSSYSGAATGTLTISPVAGSLNGARYRCIIGNAVGCKDTTRAALLRVRSASDVPALEHLDSRLTILPNPSHGRFAMSFSGYELSGSYVVTDATSRVIARGDFRGSEAAIALDAAPGIYFLSVFTPQGMLSRKIVVN